MKKSSFVKGAFIATFGIVITKVLGIIYVIPFYSLIGEQGGALYGYAYSIYGVFLSLSSVGFPLAMSKITSEYDTLGYNYLKEKAFRISKYIMIGTGILSFSVLFIFAPNIAYLILGDITGGNTIEDVTFVVRIISSAVLIVPILSTTRGYLQGHKFISVSSVATVLEQAIRVTVILLGSYIVLNLLGLGLTNAVGIAVFAATAGALIAYFYVVYKIRSHKEVFKKDAEPTSLEKKVSTKEIFRKLIVYALPFVMIAIVRSLYNIINMFTVVKTMVNRLGYSIIEAEATMSVFSTWGIKLNMIVISIATGITLSLIPNLTSDFVNKNWISINHKINKAFEILLLLAIPMVIGISMLSTPIWNVFYGNSEIGPLVLQNSIFLALSSCLFTVVLSISQALHRYKTVYISFIFAMLFKIGLNTPLMILFDSMGIHPSMGVTVSTLISIFVLVLINLLDIKKKYEIKYKHTLTSVIYILIGTIIMVLSLLLLKSFVPLTGYTRFVSIFIVLLYAFVGGGIYFAYLYFTGILKKVFGSKLKLKKRKK